MAAPEGSPAPIKPHPPVPPSPPPPEGLLRPMLRAGRWVILLALMGALLTGHHHLDDAGVRPTLGGALILYALLSTVLLRSGSLTPVRVVVIAVADLAFVGLIVEFTGGLLSPFFGLYYLVVVASAIFFEVAGGLAAAAVVIAITALNEMTGFHGARHL